MLSNKDLCRRCEWPELSVFSLQKLVQYHLQLLYTIRVAEPEKEICFTHQFGQHAESLPFSRIHRGPH